MMNSSQTWGFIGTLLWGTFIVVILLGLGQIIPIYMVAFFSEPMVDLTILRSYMAEVETNAWLISLSTIGSTLFVVPLVFLIAKLKNKTNLTEYFSLNTFSRRSLLFWIALIFVLYFLEDMLMVFFSIQETPDFMLNIKYPTELSKIILPLGVVFFAPILEEIIFRGFILTGLSNSFIGVLGAIIISSFVWAGIHFQYEVVYLGMIFITGLFLGYAKIKTNSLFIPILMHMFFNFLAMLELYIDKGIV